jgi:hypothetical protein
VPVRWKDGVGDLFDHTVAQNERQALQQRARLPGDGLGELENGQE